MQGFGIAVIAEIARNRRNRALFPQRYEANRQTGLKFALRMKSLFAGYYRPTPDEFNELWKNCIFVFDASVLLDLYRSTAKTRDVVLSILSKIKDRIWIPYQAAWEYQENRLEVITKERALYSELRDTFDGLLKSVEQKMHNHAVESAEKIKGELEQATKKIIEIIEQGATDHPDLMTSDHIREKITELFDGKVGKQLDEKRLVSIYQEGAKRYEAKIPPGYEDAKKGGNRQFGDLVLWMETLEHAKVIKQPVIFITSDAKEDWWWKHGQFTVGPRPELVQEIATIANVKFYMYNVERFLSEAQARVDTKVEPTEVKQAAEEFKEIEQKRKLEVADDFAPNLESLRLWSSEAKEKLNRMSSSQWGKLLASDFFNGIQISLGRALTPDETQYLLSVWFQKDVMDSLAIMYPNCWNVAEFLAFILRELKGVLPAIPKR